MFRVIRYGGGKTFATNMQFENLIFTMTITENLGGGNSLTIITNGLDEQLRYTLNGKLQLKRDISAKGLDQTTWYKKDGTIDKTSETQRPHLVFKALVVSTPVSTSSNTSLNGMQINGDFNMSSASSSG